MQIQLMQGLITEVLCDTLIINLFEDVVTPSGATGAVDKALNGQISTVLRDQTDCGKYGKTTIIYTFDRIGAKRVLLLGLGKKEELTFDKIRALSAIAIRAAGSVRSTTAATIVHGAGLAGHDAVKAAQATVEGAILGSYQFTYYKTDKSHARKLEKLIVVEQDSAKLASYDKAIAAARMVGEGVTLARDLVNHPSQYMTPTKMAWHAAEIARKYNLDLTVLDKDQMQDLQMNALLAVAKGSNEPPKLIILKYTGDPTNHELTAYVGKGITFDSGGISLKPSAGMQEMKDDMAGGAAVIGAMAAIAQLKPRINIVALVPCTENMPSGHALKPGDVISSMNGKTIEIITTDAEGRLVLADAITYANKLGATRIVDLATLTGACVVALGSTASGVISNNREWCHQVLQSSKHAGEKMWELPSFPEYKEQIKSDIADLKNSGGREAGAITAGVFLAEFTENTPWVHIDIAGTANCNKTSGYQVKGATGVGVRTLIDLAYNNSVL